MLKWFDVDKAGLAAVLERRGKTFAVTELLANSWDSGTERVVLTITPEPDKPYVHIEVEDWGDGFADITDSFTLFSLSRRAADAEKRGRFSLGEKLVLSICTEAEIATTCGRIQFKPDGSKRGLGPLGSGARESGTKVTGRLRMTREEYQEVCSVIDRLIPPVPTEFNGKLLEIPRPIAVIEVKLPTEFADADGNLRRTVRLTRVEIHEDEFGSGEIYELGIPVVETNLGYRVNVLQKVPLNLDRDNVPPSYLKTLSAHVLNSVVTDLTPEQAAEPWVQEAAGSSLAKPDTVKRVLTHRFGEHAVVATPGAPVSNAQAEQAGFTVIPGGALSREVWANVRKHELLPSAAAVFPTPTAEEIERRRALQAKCPTCGQPV
jgi:hypothetical protein